MLSALWQLPVFKQVRQSSWLNEHLRVGFGPYWGAFPSREEAIEFLRPSKRAVADDDAMAQMNVELFSKVHSFDWPLLFFLMKAQNNANLRTVTDLGGHLAVKYHAYRTQMDFLDNLIWQVVDVPAVCRAGRRALDQNENQLVYLERLEDTAPCDTLICSGVLQYLDFTLSEAIERLPAKPRLVLLNKIAVSEHEPFFTLESVGHQGRIPYNVTTKGTLDLFRSKLGYRLLAQWDLPGRDLPIFSQLGRRTGLMVGEAWSLDT